MRIALDAHAGVALRPAGSMVRGAVTYRALARAASELARGLAALDIDIGDRVSILSPTRSEWTLADLGILLSGAVVVPIDHTDSAERCAQILAHSGARAVICEDDEQLAKVDSIAGRCPALRQRIMMTGSGARTIALDDVRARGRLEHDSLLFTRGAAVAADDVATIVYSSSETEPLACAALTHANLLAATASYRGDRELDAGAIVHMVVPLEQTPARVAQLGALTAGATITFACDDHDRQTSDEAAA